MPVTMGDSSAPNYNNANTTAGSATFTLNPPTTGQVALITMTGVGTVTFGAPTNILEGAAYKIIAKAGDSSARTYAWNAAYKFPSGTPVVTTAAGQTGYVDIMSFTGGASNVLYYDGSITNVH